MTVQEMIRKLQEYPPGAVVRFSMAIDDSLDPTERWFCDTDPEDFIADQINCDHGAATEASEVTICIVGVSNLKER
jgi:hypothetical protein